MKKPRTVLIVTYFFPPISTSGGMRPLGFSRYLKEYDWRVRILTVDPASTNPPLPLDETLVESIPPDTRVDRVGHPNTARLLVRLRDRTRGAFRFRSDAPDSMSVAAGTNESASHGGVLRRFQDAAVERFFEFPDRQREWLRPAVRYMRAVPVDERPDIVLATGGPWTALLIGQCVARHFGVPLVTDFRDPWTRNPGRQPKSRWADRRSYLLERSVVESSSRVIANTPELERQFRDDYPAFGDRFRTITNGFDSLHDADSSVSADARSPTIETIELCHFGTVYHRRNPEHLMRAIQELADDGLLPPKRLLVRFIGTWGIDDASSNQLVRALEGRGLVRREPPIPHQECLREMRRVTALLVLQPASPLQIPGKIYEYVATRRPILVVGGEGATASLVTRHRLGLCCANDTATIKSLLKRVIDADLQLQSPPDDQTAGFHYRALSARLAEVLEETLRAR